MDWNGNPRVPFATRPDNPLSFHYNFNYDQFPAAGLEMKLPAMVQATTQHTMQLPTLMDKNNFSTSSMNDIYGQQDPKKKKLSNEQLESLENSFQEEIKLDPDRKMKLAKELGLQPRQIAVWFQNRRARWRSKQLERLYDTLKQEFDVVSREKHKLQQEVVALRAILKEEVTKKQVSTGYTEASGGEETVESTSMAGTDKPCGMSNVHQVTECNYALNADDYNQVMMTPYNWASLPHCP